MHNIDFKINEHFEKYEFLIEMIKDYGSLSETKMWDCSTYQFYGMKPKAIYLYFNSDLLKVVKLIFRNPISNRNIVCIFGEEKFFKDIF